MTMTNPVGRYSQENQKNKPLEQPVIIGEDEEGRSENTNPVDDSEDGEFDLDNDVDLGSPLLDSMLSDRQPALDQENVMASMVTVACRTRDSRTDRGQLGKSIIELDNIFLTISRC